MKTKNMFLNVLGDCFIRLKVPGLTIGIINTLITALIILTSGTINETGYFDFFCALTPHIVVPILTFTAFNFLFKRSSSDFYHSLPVKKSTLFLANSLSVFCWILILVFSLFLMSGALLDIDLDLHLETLLYTLISALYTYGISSFAINLTGRALPALINIFVFYLMPHLLLQLFDTGISYKIPFVILELPQISDLFLLAEGGNDLAYYIITGALLFIIALITFIYRKSETAEQSAPNNILKITYCALAASLVSLVSLSSIITKKQNLTLIIVFYSLSAVLCFGYSLLSRKGIQGVKNAFISLIAVILFNVLFISSLSIATFYFKHKRLDISGFQAYVPSKYNARQNEHWGDYRTYSLASYGLLMAEDYYITDEEICNELEEIYSSIAHENSITTRIVDNKETSIGISPITFIIKDKLGRKHYRNLPLLSNEISTLIREPLTNEDSEFLSLITQVPPIEKINKISIVNIDSGIIDYSADEEFYNVFVEEMSLLTPKQKTGLLLKAPSIITAPLNTPDDNRHHYYVLNVSGEHNNQLFSSRYIVNNDLLPKTYDALLKAIKEDNKRNFEDFKLHFNVDKLTEYDGFSIRVEFSYDLSGTNSVIKEQFIDVQKYNGSPYIYASYAIMDNTHKIQYGSADKISYNNTNNLINSIYSLNQETDGYNTVIEFSTRTGKDVYQSFFTCHLTQEEFISLSQSVQGDVEK